jgi:hypothetical protein
MPEPLRLRELLERLAEAKPRDRDELEALEASHEVEDREG